MIFSETPAFFSFTKSAVVRLAGLFSLCRVLMIRLSDNPAFTDWITESTGEEAAAGLAAAGLAAAGLGAGGVWARPTVARRLSDARVTSFIKILQTKVLTAASPRAHPIFGWIAHVR
jgi:hypothetical protein